MVSEAKYKSILLIFIIIIDLFQVDKFIKHFTLKYTT